MSPRPDVNPALRQLLALSGPKRLVAVAGPPGAGKSTFAASLACALQKTGHSAVVVPMDGFHLDNRVLEANGLLNRKGAPETFDGMGFVHLVERIASGEHVVYPIFDRDRDMSISGAAELSPDTDFVIFEGNYLLCDVAPWDRLLPFWRFSIFLDPGPDTIGRRLLSRWKDQGLSETEARRRRDENDMPNALFVSAHSVSSDLAVHDQRTNRL